MIVFLEIRRMSALLRTVWTRYEIMFCNRQVSFNVSLIRCKDRTSFIIHTYDGHNLFACLEIMPVSNLNYPQRIVNQILEVVRSLVLKRILFTSYGYRLVLRTYSKLFDLIKQFRESILWYFLPQLAANINTAWLVECFSLIDTRKLSFKGRCAERGRRT